MMNLKKIICLYKLFIEKTVKSNDSFEKNNLKQ